MPGEVLEPSSPQEDSPQASTIVQETIILPPAGRTLDYEEDISDEVLSATASVAASAATNAAASNAANRNTSGCV